METNENVRSRFQTYMSSEPATYVRVGKAIGLNDNQSRYLLSRFAGNKQKLYPDTLSKLSDFLSARGY